MESRFGFGCEHFVQIALGIGSLADGDERHVKSVFLVISYPEDA